LGAALAVEYAQTGRTLGLIARNERRLADVAALCTCAGARCATGLVDITDQVAVERWLHAFDDEHPIDLLFVNAGVYTGHGPSRRMETIDEVLWLIRTNLEGAAITVDAVLPGMRRRRRGRIVLVGSLAALQSLADAPGYSASKAGLVAYGEALREYLAPEGISVSIICPGYIDTAQTAHHVGALPLQMSPQQAAAIIRRRVDRGRSFIAFPFRLHLLICLGRLVDWRTRAFFGRGLRFHTEKSSRPCTEAISEARRNDAGDNGR
jgi:short-subunit dehydrogenase